jgi:hypothetical protein
MHFFGLSADQPAGSDHADETQNEAGCRGDGQHTYNQNTDGGYSRYADQREGAGTPFINYPTFDGQGTAVRTTPSHHQASETLVDDPYLGFGGAQGDIITYPTTASGAVSHSLTLS